MNIIISDIKNNKQRSVKNVQKVLNRGYYFKVVYKDNTYETYLFKYYDVFLNR